MLVTLCTSLEDEEGKALLSKTSLDLASSTSELKVIFEMSLVANSFCAPFLNAILKVYAGDACSKVAAKPTTARVPRR